MELRSDNLFNSFVYSDMIVKMADMKRKHGYEPELDYDSLVSAIAAWMNSWMRFTMPKVSEMVDLLSDAFLLVMKAKRMKCEEANYEAFIEAIRADVYKELMYRIRFCNKGVREYYNIKL